MSKTNGHFFKSFGAFLPAVVWACCIYYLSSRAILPGFAVNTWDFILKKSAHVFSFGFLYFLLFRAFQKTTQLSGNTVWVVPLLVTVLYAAFDEIHQSFVPGRHGTFRDIGFDTLGCCLVMLRKFGYI